MHAQRLNPGPLHTFFQGARRACLLVAVATAVGCGGAAPEESVTMDRIAESYVKLVLSVGPHDEAFIDAYYGPEAWRTEAEAAATALPDLQTQARALIVDLERMEAPSDPMDLLRTTYLHTQLVAVEARLRMLQGERLSFDQESKALYDSVAPTHPESYFQAILDRLDPLLPGNGSLIERWDAFRMQFVIPPDKLDAVFRVAIDACKERTARQLTLPDAETFRLEYVNDQPWSGYNWYQGGFESLIQVNVDLPIYIDRAIDLACHEGYPGHHVYNMLLEQALVQQRGWMEFSVYPLFSPQSLIAEGTANYGIEMAFPGDERLTFERDVLFPLAGLDAADAERYYEILGSVEQLSYAGNEAARRYLNGEIDATQTAEFLTRFAMMPSDRAEQRVRFIDRYRSYVINYNLGKDLVQHHVEAAGDSQEARWAAFGELLSSPRLPSGLTH